MPDFIVQFILNERNEPEPCDDPIRFAFWHEHDERRFIRRQSFVVGEVAVEVSTVFLGINHDFTGEGPVLWETMAFSPDPLIDGTTCRYRSLAQAIEGHNDLVAVLGGPRLE